MSVFDIAVMRAVGTTSWPDCAVEWALKYLCTKVIRSKINKQSKRMGVPPSIHISTSYLGSPGRSSPLHQRLRKSQSVEPTIKSEKDAAMGSSELKDKRLVGRTESDSSIIVAHVRAKEKREQSLSSESPSIQCSNPLLNDYAEVVSTVLYGSSLDRPQQRKQKALKQQESSVVSMDVRDEIDLSYYVAPDLRLSIPAIFDVITYQILWSQSAFSSRVYEGMLNLIRECLCVGFQSFSSRHPISAIDTAAPYSISSPPPTRSVSYNQEEEFQFLRKALWTVLLLLRHLGCCEHGCKYGIKGRQGRRLHALVSECLSMIAQHNLLEFKKHIRCIIVDKPLVEVLSCLHAFFCFCTIENDTTLQNCVQSLSTLKTSIRINEEGGAGSFDDLSHLQMSDVQIPVGYKKGKENVEVGMVKIVLSHLTNRLMTEDMGKPATFVSLKFGMEEGDLTKTNKNRPL